MQTRPTEQSTKPVIALMGEFSAGKSTLANLLICEGRSPVKVTATQRPPVWYAHGTDAPYIVDVRGEVTTIDDAQIDDVRVASTKYIKVFVAADILEFFDIIDMPGNSDPNMSSDIWRRASNYADGVIWCSHATQAWRQSEAAIWDEMPPELYDWSLLLLTRFDKLLTESDRRRVVARVQKETQGLFRELFPISLLEAVEAGDDHQQWIDSGADAFVRCLLDLATDLQTRKNAAPSAPAPTPAREGAPSLRAVTQSAPQHAPPQAEAPDQTLANGIAPRRVERRDSPARPRPPRPEAGGSLG